MPLSFFPLQLGTSNSFRSRRSASPEPLFLTSMLGMPNYGLGAIMGTLSQSLPFGSRRLLSTAPNGSSFPSVASGAKGPFSFHPISTAALPRNIRRGHAS
jgi:hypothetical protein